MTTQHLPLIVCMKWGTRYEAEYVNRLYNMCSRAMARDFRFICFTDDGTGVDEGVEIYPLPDFPSVPTHLANKPWRKLSLWQENLFDLQGEALFLDLDVVIVGPLDDFFDYALGKYCVIHNFTQPKLSIGNTSIFRFTIGKYPHIYSDFVADPEGVYARYKIEQQYISGEIGSGEQVFWPKTWCRSFKNDCLPPVPLRWWQEPFIPDDARVIVFHGKPDPDEAMVGKWPIKKWYKRFYKIVRPTPWIAEYWQ